MFSKTVLRQRFGVFSRVCPVVYLRSIHDGPTNVTDHYDVIIAGGGMVGTTLACTLGQSKKLSNKKILLLEGGKDQKYKLQPKYSNRVVALNPSSKHLLSSIGAWQHISNARVTSVNKMQVWDACSDAMITFHHDNLNQDIAYIVENNVLLSAVSQEAHDCANVSVVYGAKIKSYELLESCPGITTSRVHMEDGVSYSCSLLRFLTRDIHTPWRYGT
uniref:Ubiquinone biosynthesis monooxygenase COQ6 n=1 Tax=Timema douglasi TaxID=61478 RepID=A0A7R8ZA52_TIMDO|nr:unnamed protein product [Timema douglasi]